MDRRTMFAIKNGTGAACVIVGMLFFPSHILAGEVLRVGGTGSTNEMIKSLGVLFAAETGIKVDIIPGLGTGGGNSALADGVMSASRVGRLTQRKSQKDLSLLRNSIRPLFW